MRAPARGRLVEACSGGQASGEHLAQVLHEDRLDDEGLAARIVVRLERQGFGELSDRQKGSKLKALDEQIAKATAELREARKAEALEQVEREVAERLLAQGCPMAWSARDGGDVSVAGGVAARSCGVGESVRGGA